MKKYGLQLRGPQSTTAKKPLPPPKKPSIFSEDDDDEDNVEQAIARQAAKNRALKQVEQQHKAALEQDPTVFSYDEVYDDMKAASTTSTRVGPELSKPKYITKLLEKAQVRQQEQEIIYERKLLKERQCEDHLYGDKDKFVTSAYKKKLAEQAKWLEEERLRELREQAEEVTNRGDLSDFYHNLFTKNVAFGAKDEVPQKGSRYSEQESAKPGGPSLDTVLDRSSNHLKKSEPEKASISGNNRDTVEVLETESSSLSESKPDLVYADEELRDAPVTDSTEEENTGAAAVAQADRLPEKGAPFSQLNSQRVDRKPSEDALAAARERYLARKRART